ncbi:Uncharacterised protein [Klebsiella pneumoniae]|uniref:Uncharacterized protein n=1 Tax=Klebsiella pneumoniae TaxID=573 RepID=A0A378F3V9_KLEPN|nr:Uncharacterised protein [Klebsiella pneumoniae]
MAGGVAHLNAFRFSGRARCEDDIRQLLGGDCYRMSQRRDFRLHGLIAGQGACSDRASAVRQPFAKSPVCVPVADRYQSVPNWPPQPTPPAPRSPAAGLSGVKSPPYRPPASPAVATSAPVSAPAVPAQHKKADRFAALASKSTPPAAVSDWLAGKKRDAMFPLHRVMCGGSDCLSHLTLGHRQEVGKRLQPVMVT